MAQWFHRNPFKASGCPNFDLGPIATSIDSRMILSKMAEKRQVLIRLLSDYNNSREAMVDATNQYLTLLMGLASAPDTGEDIMTDDEDTEDGEKEKKAGDANEEETPEPGTSDVTEKTKKDKKEHLKLKKEQKKKVSPEVAKKVHSLRRLIQFTWTNSLDTKHRSPITVRDANFEVAGILFNLALWFSKHAAKMASCDHIDTPQAVEIFKSLKNAAALFEYIKRQLLPLLRNVAEKGSDLDPTVVEAYMLQSLAEAQEVTIARAMELKHDPGLIAALSAETANLYEKCKFGIQSLPEDLVAKWRLYCIFKTACFRAYAHCFYSESELKADRCGMAIASAQEALKYCTQAQNAAKVYRSGSGAEFCFVRRLQPYAQRTLTKAQTENAMIYHQKAPTSMPQLQLKATYGVATPEMPEGLVFTVDESWTEAMPGFDTTKVGLWMKQKNYLPKCKEAKKLKAIPEQVIYQGDKDPNNASGCVIS